jgi:hypothetical protein
VNVRVCVEEGLRGEVEREREERERETERAVMGGGGLKPRLRVVENLLKRRWVFPANHGLFWEEPRTHAIGENEMPEFVERIFQG